MSKKHILFLVIGKILSGSSSKEEEERVDKILYDSFISEDWNEDELGSEQHMQNRIADRVNEAVVTVKYWLTEKKIVRLKFLLRILRSYNPTKCN